MVGAERMQMGDWVAEAVAVAVKGKLSDEQSNVKLS